MLSFLVKIGILKVSENNYNENLNNKDKDNPDIHLQEIEGKVDVVIENPKHEAKVNLYKNDEYIDKKLRAILDNIPFKKRGSELVEEEKSRPLQIEGEVEVDVKQQLKDTIEELRGIEEEGQPIGAKHLDYDDYQDESYLEELKDTGLMDNGKCVDCGRLVYQSWKKNPDGTAIYHKYCHQKRFFGKNKYSYYNSKKYKKQIKLIKQQKKSNKWF